MSTTTTKHPVATRDAWLTARQELLEAEKAHTRQGDALAQRRQALPWVPVDKDYRFETAAGPATFGELFQGRSQLIVYHFMFGPDYAAGCPSCSSIAESFDGYVRHLGHHDVTFTAISRAPLPKLQAFQHRMGWHFPWASAAGTDFNYDFRVSFTDEQQRTGQIEYNYRPEPAFAWDPAAEGAAEHILTQFANSTGTDVPAYIRDRPGMSAFIQEDGVIYHTYSAYSRGLDGLWGMLQWLDRAPLGRNETTGPWWRRHDEYIQPAEKNTCCCP